MTIVTKKVTIYSEEGDIAYPNAITLKLDDSQINRPVTFYGKGNAFFSICSDEIQAFVKALIAMDSNA